MHSIVIQNSFMESLHSFMNMSDSLTQNHNYDNRKDCFLLYQKACYFVHLNILAHICIHTRTHRHQYTVRVHIGWAVACVRDGCVCRCVVYRKHTREEKKRIITRCTVN